MASGAEIPGIRVVEATGLVPDARNARARDKRARRTLEASLEQFGAARSIVIDADDNVRAGNGTLEAFLATGGSEVIVVDATPGQLVAVRRSDWTPAQAKAYAIADNRTAELAEWDPVPLVETLKEVEAAGVSMGAIGFTGREIGKLNDGLANRLTMERCDEDNPKLAAFIARRAQARAEGKDKAETNFWVCVVFDSFEQKDEFLRAIPEVPSVYKQYVDGRAFAKRCGVTLEPRESPVLHSPLDRGLVAMVLDPLESGSRAPG
ncbi:MAG: ParB N-terminal domain-containing protein [Candidatus Limnocylindrales bacterium]